MGVSAGSVRWSERVGCVVDRVVISSEERLKDMNRLDLNCSVSSSERYLYGTMGVALRGFSRE